MARTKAENPRFQIWDEELVGHFLSDEKLGDVPIVPKTGQGDTTIECRAILQAKDQFGNNWTGERIVRIKLKKDKK